MSFQQKLTRYQPIDTVSLKREIADRIIDPDAYPFQIFKLPCTRKRGSAGADPLFIGTINGDPLKSSTFSSGSRGIISIIRSQTEVSHEK